MLSLTRFILRHKLIVAACWLVLAVAGALSASTATSRMAVTFSMPGPAAAADARIAADYGMGAADPVVPVVTVPAGQSVTDPGVATRVGAAFAAAARLAPGSRVVDLATTGDRSFVTADRRSTFAMITVPQAGPMGGTPLAARIQGALRSALPAGWTVQVTGIDQLANSAPAPKGFGVLAETMLGGLGALAVLAFVFASLLALLPLLVAGASILTTFLVVLGLTHVMSVSFVVVFLIALIGLGVAIDYSLLVVTRWREERAHGADPVTAVETAMVHAGRSVVFSGVTVGIGLLALMVLPVPFLRSTGVGGVLVPLISVAAAITLLPVVLSTAGPWLDRWRLRSDAKASPFWTRWARFTVRRKGVAASVGAIALAALMIPALWLHTGEPSTDSLAQSGPAHQALATLEAGGVPSGSLTPITVQVAEPDVAAVTGRLRTVPGVDAAVAPTAGGNRAHGTALVTVLPTAETDLAAGQRTVTAIRTAAAGWRGVLGVSGSGAALIDFSDSVYGAFPLMLGLIALATFLLLARAFRSLLLPLKAVVLNLASLGAAYGVMVLVWQQGGISQALWGIPSTGVITMWVPVMVFAFLFGLSMDYEVFILSRMREAHDAGSGTGDAVVQGIGRTGRLVTSAALILVLSFVAMSTTPQTDVKILATGLAAGIAVDATIVRCLLVPALVGLFGRWNWWLPGPVARVLRVPASPAVDAAPAPHPDERVDLAVDGAVEALTGR